jgi:hypothetical protein
MFAFIMQMQCDRAFVKKKKKKKGGGGYIFRKKLTTTTENSWLSGTEASKFL